MLVEVVVIITAVAGVLVIGKKVGVIVKRVTLQPYILLRVKVLIKKKVLVRGRSVVV